VNHHLKQKEFFCKLVTTNQDTVNILSDQNKISSKIQSEKDCHNRTHSCKPEIFVNRTHTIHSATHLFKHSQLHTFHIETTTFLKKTRLWRSQQKQILQFSMHIAAIITQQKKTWGIYHGSHQQPKSILNPHVAITTQQKTSGMCDGYLLLKSVVWAYNLTRFLQWLQCICTWIATAASDWNPPWNA
jgi:hypothetical protein